MDFHLCLAILSVLLCLPFAAVLGYTAHQLRLTNASLRRTRPAPWKETRP